ncbi:hypothetical protein GCM10009001_15920 [Virgibacillus siamensis]|uniref:Uncharacterized protein n=1 Tax=Virgibacillus siamensis TaxID=480071 RepID=A0ABP3QZX2_9BACI
MNKKTTLFILGTDHLDNPNNGDMFMPQNEDMRNKKDKTKLDML